MSCAFGSLLSGAVHAPGVSGKTIGLIVLYGFCTYIFVMVLSVFVATLTRSIGGSLPIVILMLVFMGLVPTFTIIGQAMEGGESTLLTYLPSHIAMWIDPIFMLGIYSNSTLMSSLITGTDNSVEMILAGIIVPIFWSAVFGFAGLKMFQYRDIK